jgi:regulation of enolase protein 1 (concanavalin A-like superfamily)
MEWLNEPPAWSEEDSQLTVMTGERTDFWRKTHYGFIRDDGHLRYRTVTGDFTASVLFSGSYDQLYDQAGLMLRVDEKSWLKAGVELVDGRQMLSAVVTCDFSDWSAAPAPPGADWLELRVTRHGETVRVEWAIPAARPQYTLLRLARLPMGEAVKVGPMCCSPERAGFRARFRAFRVGPPISADLHAEAVRPPS